MLRVLHVASGREWRGGQQQVLLLARELAATSNVSCAVVTGRGTLLSERLREAGVPVHEVAWGPGLDPRVAGYLLRQLTSDTIVHAHDGHAHTLADLAARWCGAPLVVTRRDMPVIRHPRRYQRAAAVIAISSAVRQRLIEARISPAHIHLIPDGIDIDTPLIRARTIDRPAGMGALPLIVCIAALQRVKGVDVLLDAAATLRVHRPDARWVVLGEGPERAQLEAQRTALRLDDIVQFRGFIAAPDAVLASATLAVQPSRVEALGSSVLDALALGVPVVASDVDGLPEALAHGGGVLVPPESPAHLAATLRHLLDDTTERSRLAAEGPAAAEYFSADRLVERTLNVYRSIAHNPGSR